MMRRGAPAALGAILLAVTMAARSGPVEVYREGAQFCPRDRAAGSPEMTEDAALDRARALLPVDFCGPSWFVSGCDAVPEFALGTWRIYVQQYKLRGTSHDWGGLAHTYVVLDRLGNCEANIPGTEVGAPR